MKSFAAARKAIVIAALLVSSTALAHAAHRTGTALDEPAHPRATALVAHPNAPASRAPALDDESPCLKPCVPVSPGTTAVRPGDGHALPHPALPASGDHRGEKRERGRATTNGMAQVHRPLANRGKGQVRNTPATPGMGLLLRFGTNAGREISMNTDDFHDSPGSLRSGRAPPRGSPHPTLAPAALPRPHSPATPSRDARPASTFPGAAPLQTDPKDDRYAPCVLRGPIAPAVRAPGEPAVAPLCVNLERPARSRVARVKGVAACSTRPFGGCIA